MSNNISNRETREAWLALSLRRSERELLDAAARKEGETTSGWARRTLVGFAALQFGSRHAPEEEQ
jgi:uncharacterized protein (DUF1778 family)